MLLGYIALLVAAALQSRLGALAMVAAGACITTTRARDCGPACWRRDCYGRAPVPSFISWEPIVSPLVVLLVAAELGAIEVRRRNIARARSRNSELVREAETDPLTHLWNRRALEDDIEAEIARSRRHTRSFAFLMANVDRFKRVNDAAGHAGGDAVLVAIASRLLRDVRGIDRVYRFGGDEFCVLYPECDTARAVRAAERLRQAIGGSVTHGLRVTISVGVAVFPDDGTTVNEIVGQAEHGLLRGQTTRPQSRAGGSRGTGARGRQMSSLHVELAPGHKQGLRLQNPVMLAAGTAGYGLEYARLVPLEGLGAVVSCGITPRPRACAPGRRGLGAPAGLIWAAGYPNCGVAKLVRAHAPRWEHRAARYIVNVCGTSAADMAAVAKALDDQPGVSAIELNLLSANEAAGWQPFCASAECAAAAVRDVRRACGLPLLAKMAGVAANPAGVAQAYHRGRRRRAHADRRLARAGPGRGARPAGPRARRLVGGSGPSARPRWRWCGGWRHRCGRPSSPRAASPARRMRWRWCRPARNGRAGWQRNLHAAGHARAGAGGPGTRGGRSRRLGGAGGRGAAQPPETMTNAATAMKRSAATARRTRATGMPRGRHTL